MTLLETIDALRLSFPIRCEDRNIVITGPVEAFQAEPETVALVVQFMVPLGDSEITACLEALNPEGK